MVNNWFYTQKCLLYTQKCTIFGYTAVIFGHKITYFLWNFIPKHVSIHPKMSTIKRNTKYWSCIKYLKIPPKKMFFFSNTKQFFFTYFYSTKKNRAQIWSQQFFSVWKKKEKKKTKIIVNLPQLGLNSQPLGWEASQLPLCQAGNNWKAAEKEVTKRQILGGSTLSKNKDKIWGSKAPNNKQKKVFLLNGNQNKIWGGKAPNDKIDTFLGGLTKSWMFEMTKHENWQI